MKLPKFKVKIPRKYKRRLVFTGRLLVIGIAFYGLWSLAPDFPLLKLATAQIVAWTTGSTVLTGSDGVFVRHGDSLLQIVTDCTAWKEVIVFLALFFSWPKKKKLERALYSVGAILLYNLIRLDILVIFPNSFDYFHPAFQYVSIAFILFFWTWAVGIRRKLKF